MQVDISLDNAKVYNFERADIVLGQKFSLTTDSGIPLRWFADQDAVLAMVVNESSVDIEATGLGESIILIMDTLLNQVKKLTIKVVDAIQKPAADLGLSSDSAIPK